MFPLHNIQKLDCLRILVNIFAIGLLWLMVYHHTLYKRPKKKIKCRLHFQRVPNVSRLISYFGLTARSASCPQASSASLLSSPRGLLSRERLLKVLQGVILISLYKYKTWCSWGCSTNTFVTHSLIHSDTDPLYKYLLNTLTPKL